jgi:2-polyprenyl-6-methoxyphenol hydroxylase-like FAD-dependent oxidoreductase
LPPYSACQALEDAVALGAPLTDEPDLEAGLLRYQHLRLRRANEFARLSRQTSAAIQSENRILSAARNLGARLMPAGLMLRQLDRTLSGT